VLKNPDILDCVADVNLKEFVVKTFDDANYLDRNGMCLLEQDEDSIICDSAMTLLQESLFSLPDTSILRLSDRLDILIALPDLFVIDILNKRPDLVTKLSKEVVIALAKRKPWLVGEYSLQALTLLVQREDVLMELTDRDLSNLLAFQPNLLTILSSLPPKKFVMFLAVHIDILDTLQPSALQGLRRILQNKEIIRAIPTELHAKMAKKPIIVKIMDKFTLLDVLESHPYVITRLTASELAPYIRFLYGVWFRDRLPCPTVRVATKDPDFFNKLPTDLLAKVITSRHLISCIERQDLENIMNTSDIGSRLTFSTLMFTARNLRLSQLSLRLALSMANQVSRSTPTLFFN